MEMFGVQFATRTARQFLYKWRRNVIEEMHHIESILKYKKKEQKRYYVAPWISTDPEQAFPASCRSLVVLGIMFITSLLHSMPVFQAIIS